MTTLTFAEKRLISDCIHGKGDLRWDVVEAIVAAREQAARAEIANEIDAELMREVSRLTVATGSDPYRVPMLGNWLGGIKVGRDIARGDDPRGTQSIRIRNSRETP